MLMKDWAEHLSRFPETSSNIYHAEIFENKDKAPLGQLKALTLADGSGVIAYEPEVKWV